MRLGCEINTFKYILQNLKEMKIYSKNVLNMSEIIMVKPNRKLLHYLIGLTKKVRISNFF